MSLAVPGSRDFTEWVLHNGRGLLQYPFRISRVELAPETLYRGRNSVVECQLPKLDVRGSNPLARFDLRRVLILVAPPVAPTRSPG